MSGGWVRRLIGNAKPEAGWLLGLLGVVVLVSVTQAAKPWPIKIAIDYVLSGKSMGDAAMGLNALPGAGTSRGQLVWLAVMTLAIFIVVQSLTVLKNWMSSVIGNRLSMRLASVLFSGLLVQGRGFHQSHSRGDLVKRVMQDAKCARVLILDVGLSMLTALVSIGVVLVVAWQIDPWMTLAAVSTIVPVFLLSRWLCPKMSEHAYQQAEQEGMLYAQAERTLSSMPIIQACSTEEREQAQFKAVADRTLSAYLRLIRSQMQFNFGVSGITALGTAIIMAWGGYRVMQGRMTVGDLWVFLSYLTMIFGPVTSLAYLTTGLAEAKARSRRIFDLLDNDQRIPEPKDPVPLGVKAGAALSLGFTDLRVGYAEGHPVLKSVNLRVRAGEMLALVGASGAGKSTMVSLIGRMLDPWEGQVSIGGVNAARLALSDLRSRIAWLPQQPTLMPMTIAQNIAFGRPDASQAEIERAAEAAGASAFIQAMPDGYQTMVGERGATLSGGQNQRLALARALLLNAGLIILDEPTASVDAQTERFIVDRLAALRGEKTIIVIAHRLSTIRAADRIAVLEEGKIVELGPHDALVEAGGHYARLMQTQLFRRIDESGGNKGQAKT